MSMSATAATPTPTAAPAPPDRVDLAILGAGPAGAAAAQAAAQHGCSVLLIDPEVDRPGGTCLNRGCIPTKALLHAAHLYHTLGHADTYGLTVSAPAVDWAGLHAYKDRIVAAQRAGLNGLLDRHGVTRVPGRGRVTAPHTVTVDDTRTVTADRILIAAGSRPALPPIPGIDSPHVVTSDPLLDTADHDVDRLVIIGGGVIGVEFAALYAQLGRTVTLFEAEDRLLPFLDEDLGKFARQHLKQLGVTVHTDAVVTRIDTATVHADVRGRTHTATGDRILVATGRAPHTDGLFAPGMTPALNGRHIAVDAGFRTDRPDIWAVGDIIGGCQLAHEAEAEARTAVADMLGYPPTDDLRYIPACVYLPTEIASLGLPAGAPDIPHAVLRHPVTANARQQIEDLGRGFVKLVYAPDTRRLLGIHLACGRATDLIAEYAVHLRHGRTVDDLLAAVRPHPSFAESLSAALHTLPPADPRTVTADPPHFG